MHIGADYWGRFNAYWGQLLGPIQCVLGPIFQTYFCLTKGRHLAPIIGADSMRIGANFPNLFFV